MHFYNLGKVPQAKTQAKPMNIEIKSELGIRALNEHKWELSKGWFGKALNEISPSKEKKDGVEQKWILEKLELAEFRVIFFRLLVTELNDTT